MGDVLGFQYVDVELASEYKVRIALVRIYRIDARKIRVTVIVFYF